MQESQASLTVRICLACLWLYRNSLSLLLLDSCRFYPCCSEYAMSALKRHGAVWGLLFTLRRLMRCHPFSSGGYDPVNE